jgi:hypothetical protein
VQSGKQDICFCSHLLYGLFLSFRFWNKNWNLISYEWNLSHPHKKGRVKSYWVWPEKQKYYKNLVATTFFPLAFPQNRYQLFPTNMCFKFDFNRATMDEIQSAKYSTFDIIFSDTKHFTTFEIPVFKKYLFYKITPAIIVHSWCTFER